MATETRFRRGVIAGSAAVLRELLRTPRVRRSLDVLLGELDPENAPRLAHALMEDPSIPFDLLTAAPRLCNAATGALSALLVRLGAYPPRLLQSLLARIMDELDAEQAGALVGTALGIAVRAHQGADVARAASAIGEGFSRGFTRALASHDIDAKTLFQRVLGRALGPVTEACRAALEADARVRRGKNA